MAVLAIAFIKAFEPQNDLTFRCLLQIFVHDKYREVPNDTYFSPSDTAAVVNASIFDFVKTFISDHWGIVSAPGDTVALIGPYVVSATSIYPSAVPRLGVCVLPWEWFKLKLR